MSNNRPLALLIRGAFCDGMLVMMARPIWIKRRGHLPLDTVSCPREPGAQGSRRPRTIEKSHI